MLVSPFHSWNGKVQLRENGGNFLSGLFQGADLLLSQFPVAGATG
jgi:hypothetical protein